MEKQDYIMDGLDTVFSVREYGKEFAVFCKFVEEFKTLEPEEGWTLDTSIPASETWWEEQKLLDEDAKVFDMLPYYTNEDKECECRRCELKKTCKYKDISQRRPHPLGLGLCKKLYTEMY